MAAAPVIIDDGGSTRIKRIGKKLDGLFDDRKGRAERFDRLRIIAIDSDGNVLGPVTVNLGQTDTFEVISGEEQSVFGQMSPGGGGGGGHKCDLELKSTNTANPIDPIVEARHHRNSRTDAGQRRYVVTNAGAIERVLHNGSDVPGFSVIQPPANPFTIYTAVYLLEP